MSNTGKRNPGRRREVKYLVIHTLPSRATKRRERSIWKAKSKHKKLAAIKALIARGEASKKKKARKQTKISQRRNRT